MPPLDNIEALAFDVFGTVVDWHGSVTRELVAFGKKYSLPETEEDWSAFAKEWRKGYMTTTAAVASGRLSASLNTDTMHRNILDDMLKESRWAHISPLWDETERENAILMWHRLSGWPDAVEGLCRLKKQAIIVTLSNGNVRLQTDMAKYADLPWDVIFSSELFGSYKPNPAPYLGALKNLDLSKTPAKCVMVASHIYDLRAAASHGMTTVYIPRPGEEKPEEGEVKSKAEGGEVDVVVHTFVELAMILEERKQV